MVGAGLSPRALNSWTGMNVLPAVTSSALAAEPVSRKPWVRHTHTHKWIFLPPQLLCSHGVRVERETEEHRRLWCCLEQGHNVTTVHILYWDGCLVSSAQ